MQTNPNQHARHFTIPFAVELLLARHEIQPSIITAAPSIFKPGLWRQSQTWVVASVTNEEWGNRDSR